MTRPNWPLLIFWWLVCAAGFYAFVWILAHVAR